MRTLFWAVPLLVLVVCIGILLTTCYPTAVFLWGDGVDRYTNTVHRRRTIWTIIIGITVVGVAARFLFEDVTSWLPH